MTTEEIESIANEEALVVGASDMDLKKRLRRKVIPKWEMDVGECAWRRVNTTLAYSVGDRDKNLPVDFGKMLDGPFINSTDTYTTTRLAYLGEDIQAMAANDAGTENAIPYGYWFIRNGSNPNLLRMLRLNRPTSKALTLGYSYLSEIQFVNDLDSVILDNFIPPKFQWGLVEGLKVEIYRGRLSVDDPRLRSAMDEYDRYVILGQEYREPGMRQPNKRIKTGPL